MSSSSTANTDGPTGVHENLWKDYKYPDMERALKLTQQGAKGMINHVNAVLPFSKATSVLDIACGPGTVYRQLFDMDIPIASSTKLLGIDIAQPMLDKIHERQKTPQPGDDKTWDLVHAWLEDATRLSAADGSQSHVLSQMGIFLIPNYSLALHEAHRVLAADGVFTMSAFRRSAWNDDIMITLEQMHPERRLPRIADVWKDKDLFKIELEKHGFHDVVIHEIPLAMTYETPDQLIESLWTTIPYIKPAVEGLSEEQIRACKDAMARKIETQFPNKVLPAVTHLAVARK
ncbi:S-adenosyl-L-methionine-dependent methyltransferase [Myriangium duriaei CBS 260.36]|uniref:S-adenosyl-L-methionine-dependent methyltransferase n=1 Tax=Myriangium duriaei CBS 260.36 TaxID=1168546 RepID=A0A9P4MJB6_9PEZI|nr:S-adenosyl-L-methionine-dependent methyltransferase [Myriangium duriaei CBS 260.36]